MRTESLTIHPDLVEMEQEVSHMLAPTCANQPPLSFALCHLAAPKLSLWCLVGRSIAVGDAEPHELAAGFAGVAARLDAPGAAPPQHLHQRRLRPPAHSLPLRATQRLLSIPHVGACEVFADLWLLLCSRRSARTRRVWCRAASSRRPSPPSRRPRATAALRRWQRTVPRRRRRISTTRARSSHPQRCVFYVLFVARAMPCRRLTQCLVVA